MAIPDKLAADLLLANGKVLTMDERGSVAEAVAIKGDKIVAVGSTAEVRELGGARTEIVDLAGRTMIPGLVDPHLHLASDAAQHQFVTSATTSRTSARSRTSSTGFGSAREPRRLANGWSRGAARCRSSG